MNPNGERANRRYWAEFADAVALLLWAPRTVRELADLTETSMNSVSDKLYALHQAGVVRVIGKRWQTKGPGSPAKVYALQSKPFELADTPKETLK